MAKQHININKADYEEIANNFRMVGETRAHEIFDHRPYKNWEDLKQKVPGISDGMVEDLKKSGGYLR